MKTWLYLLSIVIPIAMNTAYAKEPVDVYVTTTQENEYVKYTYVVQNNTLDREIISVSIGNSNIDNPKTIRQEGPELSKFPAETYWVDGPYDERGGGLYEHPSQWLLTIQFYEESGNFSLD